MSRTVSEAEAASRRVGLELRHLVPVLGAVLLLYFVVPVAVLVVTYSPTALSNLAAGYVVDAAATSLLAALSSTVLAFVFGLPLAYWLSRSDHVLATVALGVVVLPLVLPPVVSGMLLLTVVGPEGLGGLTDLRLTRSLFGVVAAQTFVAAPFFVVTVKAAFDGVDSHFEEAARSLGRSWPETMRSVTIPLAKPGILAGLVLTFARAMGEFGATMMLAYYPRTLPVQIWASFISSGLDAALPVAVVLLSVALGTLLVVHGLRATPWR
ncbi:MULTISPECIES: molybdate ABC transporter permease subunit [Haloarcula]|uniref:Sulfate ABC transporter permease n=1 Tax=Haloarcula pellucida TaxID=1427151 RepID=A0A830GIY3_9EURY|nr:MULTISPECIES: ABC transporter permease subunit [Halomicroarcula]MBX0347153.1 ABC transporter permease subunit [Halomicroarcula pellucida]MDS0276973.1 ABC transporter permease subunit [Halomicroarcula sp. S1AR25-4]GGN87257.1 sulfate ABC transporter permease [Halomicroarcula pellucida]